MPEEPRPAGLSGLSPALADALKNPQPDYVHVRYELGLALAQDLPAPMRSLLLRTLAATHVALGDWESACSAARSAYTEMCARTPIDVELLIDAAHTCTTILERAGHTQEAAAVMRETLELAFPYATPPQMAQLLEIRATLTMRRVAPPRS